jgi:hypothetical protein
MNFHDPSGCFRQMDIALQAGTKTGAAMMIVDNKRRFMDLSLIIHASVRYLGRMFQPL